MSIALSLLYLQIQEKGCLVAGEFRLTNSNFQISNSNLPGNHVMSSGEEGIWVIGFVELLELDGSATSLSLLAVTLDI